MVTSPNFESDGRYIFFISILEKTVPEIRSIFIKSTPVTLKQFSKTIIQDPGAGHVHKCKLRVGLNEFPFEIEVWNNKEKI